MKVDVQITNNNPFDQNVVYRRVFDWDVDPTPFHEYITWAKVRADANVTYIREVTDNGFAEADPSIPDLDWQTHGFHGFDAPAAIDSGPDDRGGLIDINIGTLAGGETRAFTFYYGVTSSEASALAAINAVGAQAYNLGEPDTLNGKSGDPTTAIFAIDGSRLRVG